MKRIVRTYGTDNRKGLMYWCPGCDAAHSVRYEPPGWTWNGDREKPTLSPSLLTRDGDAVCHCYVTNGNIEFLSDCTHALKGRTVPIPEWPYQEEMDV